MVTSLPLTLDQVELTRGGKRILGPLSWVLAGEGVTVVLGPNGSGKTSLLKAIHGLERINRGRIDWPGGRDAARARQGFVFQSPILMRRSTVDCIAYPLLLDGMRRAEARARAAEAAGRVGLGDKLDLPVHVLSGGEKQKMAIARAMMRAPELLLLDEPTANLDGSSTREIEDILKTARAAGTRILFSTHDVGQARRLADDVIFIYRGLLHEAGPRDTFFTEPKTPEARAHIQGDLLP